MYAEILAKVINECPDGTVLSVLMKDAYIADNLKKYTDSDVLKGEIRIDDGRTIRSDQRKKIFAILRDFTAWGSNIRENLLTHQLYFILECIDIPDLLKDTMKEMYWAETGSEYFSLSDCSVSIARDFISYLLDFALKHDIPLSEPAINRTDDIDAYLYSCLMHKRCSVCGISPVNLHHHDPVGLGRNRKTIIHLKMKVQSLCPKHHDECHLIGQSTFDEKYKLYAIAVDEAICETYKLNYTE